MRVLGFPTHRSYHRSRINDLDLLGRADRSLICMVGQMLPGWRRIICMIYSSSTCFLSWICTMRVKSWAGSITIQILHNLVITAGQDLNDLYGDLSDLA